MSEDHSSTSVYKYFQCCFQSSVFHHYFKTLTRFSPARENRNLSYKWFVIVFFVDFESFNFMKYIKFVLYLLKCMMVCGCIIHYIMPCALQFQ